MFFVQNLVQDVDIDRPRRLAIELLHRQPATFADLVNGEIIGEGNMPEPVAQANEDVPEWCYCGFCMPMPTQEENKCCSTTKRPCLSRKALFYQIVLDANI